MSAEIKAEDGLFIVEGDIFDEDTAKRSLDFFEKNPEKIFDVLTDVEKFDLKADLRKKILNEIIKTGRTEKIAFVNPPLKLKVVLKIIKAAGHKEIKTFKSREEAMKYLEGD